MPFFRVAVIAVVGFSFVFVAHSSVSSFQSFIGLIHASGSAYQKIKPLNVHNEKGRGPHQAQLCKTTVCKNDRGSKNRKPFAFCEKRDRNKI